MISCSEQQNSPAILATGESLQIIRKSIVCRSSSFRFSIVIPVQVSQESVIGVVIHTVIVLELGEEQSQQRPNTMLQKTLEARLEACETLHKHLQEFGDGMTATMLKNDITAVGVTELIPFTEKSKEGDSEDQPDLKTVPVRKAKKTDLLATARKIVRELKNKEADSIGKTLSKLPGELPEVCQRIKDLASDKAAVYAVGWLRSQSNAGKSAQTISKYRTSLYGFMKEVRTPEHSDTFHRIVRDLTREISVVKNETERDSNIKARSGREEIKEWVAIVEWARSIVENPLGRCWEDLLLALILLTGRRPYELMVCGSFEATGESQVKFTGQAKMKGRVDPEVSGGFIIPLLGYAESCIQAMEVLRARVRQFNDRRVIPWSDDQKFVNELTATPLRRRLKSLPALKGKLPEGFVPYSFRRLYSRISCMHRPNKSVSESVYSSMVLGHDESDVESANRYNEKYFFIEPDDTFAY
jgi:hypothetical protein